MAERVIGFVDRCVYFDGEHVKAAVNCPHQEETWDQEGPFIPEGWTVQQIS